MKAYIILEWPVSSRLQVKTLYVSNNLSSTTPQPRDRITWDSSLRFPCLSLSPCILSSSHCSDQSPTKGFLGMLFVSFSLPASRWHLCSVGLSLLGIASFFFQFLGFTSVPCLSPFLPLIRKLTENVPSFKEGGALWFTDLTTPDSLFILPVLTALTFWITVEFNAQEGLEGNPTANTIKNVSKVFVVLTIPLTASFPKAIFCYWITSNLFSLAYGLVIKKPGVKKLLGVPIIPMMKPLIDQKPGFSLSEVVKKYAAASSSDRVSPQLPASPQIASPSVLSQRIESLEKEVKGRKEDQKLKVMKRAIFWIKVN
ncbi:mitochondrial inner membrane protein OXA1-like [Primulina huaijiensis]|uniref:mitochondrial inner membrane protein OXA1-like n=1 Tax=Primulina huaijiensis TaxID=1492673 RepID=UPI003CC722AB